MMSIQQFQEILANSLFGGDMTIQGLCIFAQVLGVIFAVAHENLQLCLIITIPVALVFSLLGVLQTELMIILIIVAVLSLVVLSKRAIGD